MDVGQVDAVLAAQHRAVSERVRRTGMDHDQLDEIATVRRAMPDVMARIGEPTAIRSLANPDSKRATFLIRWPDARHGILKVAGCDERAEAQTLLVWQLAGVPAVRVIDAGSERGTTFLVTAYDDTPSMRAVFDERLARSLAARRVTSTEPVDDVVGDTLAEIFSSLASAHLHPRLLPLAPPLTERLRAPIREAGGLLGTTGREWGRRLTSQMEEMWQGSRERVLHGDPWVGNMLCGPAGATLLDPVGCVGPGEYDAAQAIVQVAPPNRYADMISLACRIDPALHPVMVARWAGIVLSLEAARARAGQSHLHPFARSTDHWGWTRRERAAALAHLADNLIATQHFRGRDLSDYPAGSPGGGRLGAPIAAAGVSAHSAGAHALSFGA